MEQKSLKCCKGVQSARVAQRRRLSFLPRKVLEEIPGEPEKVLEEIPGEPEKGS